VYTITQKGSAAAPKSALDTPPLPTPIYEVKKAERISINAKIDVDALSKFVAPAAVKVDENERLTMTNTIKKITNTSENRSLKILRFIEANPGCSHSEIEFGTKITGSTGYIKTHIVNGRVIASGGARKKTYTLAAGETAESIYNGGYRIRPKVEATSAPATALHADDIAVPEFLKKEVVETPAAEVAPAPKITFEMEELAHLNKKEIPVASVSVKEERKLRLAYTNDKTLMLFGLHYEPIELTKDETEELVDFCAQMDLTFNVDVTTA
jgi:hypothetical protein